MTAVKLACHDGAMTDQEAWVAFASSGAAGALVEITNPRTLGDAAKISAAFAEAMLDALHHRELPKPSDWKQPVEKVQVHTEVLWNGVGPKPTL